MPCKELTEALFPVVARIDDVHHVGEHDQGVVETPARGSIKAWNKF